MKQNDVIRGLLAERARLLAYAWSILRDRHAAEDVFQEVIVLAVEKHEQIDGPRSLIPWARTATRYKSLHLIRDQKRTHLSLGQATLDQLESQWEKQDEAPAAETTVALRTCYERLSPYSRKIVNLRYGEGLSGKKVAANLKRKDRTIYMALSRIHNTLRDCIRARLAEGCE